MSIVSSSRDAEVVRAAVEERVREERVQCASSMHGILAGDLTRVHCFVASLMNILTIGMPEPRDNVAFVQHISLRTTYVLSDLFSLVREDEASTQPAVTDESRAGVADDGHAAPEPMPPPQIRTEARQDSAARLEQRVAVWHLLQFPAGVALGVTLAGRLSLGGFCVGTLLHPELVRRLGVTSCAVVFALVIRSFSLGVVASVLAGLVSIDARLNWPLVRRTICGSGRSSTPPSPS